MPLGVLGPPTSFGFITCRYKEQFGLDFRMLGKLAVAQRNGADFRLAPGETIGALVEKYAPMFFDPNVEPMVTCKTPGEGQDILASSANNFYRDVTMADLEGFQERNQLNSRVVKRDGTLVEEVYKVGGLYDRQIRNIVACLRDAIPHADPPFARVLASLITWKSASSRRFFRSPGDTQLRIGLRGFSPRSSATPITERVWRPSSRP